VLQCVEVCCSVLQCVAVLLQCVAVCCSVLQCVAVCYSVLQYCCSVLQCVAVCASLESLVCCSIVSVCCSIVAVCCSIVAVRCESVKHSKDTLQKRALSMQFSSVQFLRALSSVQMTLFECVMGHFSFLFYVGGNCKSQISCLYRALLSVLWSVYRALWSVHKAL